MHRLVSEIWAKSGYGTQAGETLDLHSCQVAGKFLEIYRRSPDLAEIVGEPRLWHRAFWACFLHDFGKVAAGFQDQLRGKKLWGHRHEVLSLAFLPWVVSPEAEDYRWMVAAIVSHHKDAGVDSFATGHRRSLFDYYSLTASNIDETLRTLVEGTDGQSITLDKLQLMADIVRERVGPIFQANNLAGLGIEQNLNIPDPLDCDQFTQQAPEIIKDALLVYRDLIKEQLSLKPASNRLNRQAVALRGLVLLSDRLASSRASKIEPVELPDGPTLGRRLGKELDNPREHQKRAGGVTGSLIMAAPTGSGKTEAALFWARAQQEATTKKTNLIYILPYQASMNAMHRRLALSLYELSAAGEPDRLKIALLHGRSTQVLYKQLLTPGSTPLERSRLAKRANDMARLYQPSVWVTTPYQLLKAAYRLPGYEMLWTAVAGSRLIIDEVHAYDTQRLGLFIGMLAFLKKYWAVEICTMTATMPDWLRNLLQLKFEIEEGNIIPAARPIGGEMDRKFQDLFAYFRRHRLHRMEGSLEDQSVQNHILSEYGSGKSVLVCANTVKGAQAVTNVLRLALQARSHDPQASVILLHSRFSGKDRQEKEKAILSKVNADRADKSNPLIVVATQVIEVSLDLDFSTIVTEPAPLEALAQRFGRVNRRGTRDTPPAPVYVLGRAVDEGINELIYDAGLLQRTLELVEREDGQVIDEAQLTGWLNEIYGDDLGMLYQQEVLEAEHLFQTGCLNQLRAFQSDEALEEKFDALFDGVEVLPISLKAEYMTALQQESALAASQYLVSISYRQYRANIKSISKELVVVGEEDGAKQTATVLVANLVYDSDMGLQFNPPKE